jgi:2-polyprenyl-3-methyl-5-hydroxy-6-metoxy-1,4-benzoquinol methylase
MALTIGMGLRTVESIRENLVELVEQRANAYDEHYCTAGWHAQLWTKEKVESFLAYALDVEEGGNLNGKEIQYALSVLGAPDCHGMKILDYCCGAGITAIYFALCGAEVWAFDASAEAIEIAKRSAKLSGILHRTQFSVSDAQMLPYDNDFFDVAFCQSALHIVIDYPDCPYELSRVLKPGGRAIFCEEGLGYNPLLRPVRWLRRRKWIKCGGRPLRYPDIEQFGVPFSRTEIQHFNLLLQVKTAFRGQLVRHGSLRPWTRKLLRALEKVDSVLLSMMPCMKKYCGAVVVSFEK